MKYLAPLPYCDSLHKCAAHLGGWEECDEDDEIPDNPKEYVAILHTVLLAFNIIYYIHIIYIYI